MFLAHKNPDKGIQYTTNHRGINMKRKLFRTVIITIIVICLCLFVACKKAEPTEEKSPLEKRVSTYHDGVYVGANEDFTVSFITGESEKLIVIDGEVGETARFATLTVTPLASSLFNNTYTYLLKGENGEKTGELVKDVIGASFSAEVGDISSIGKMLTLSVVAEGILDSEITLTDKMTGTIGWKEALSIAAKEFADLITAESDTGNLPREIYIKLVNALADEEAPFYYYVSFIKSPSDYWAILLDPITGEVISKKA